MKKPREFHDNESENISGESIGAAALINFFVPDAALIRVNKLLQVSLRVGETSSLLGDEALPLMFASFLGTKTPESKFEA